MVQIAGAKGSCYRNTEGNEKRWGWGVGRGGARAHSTVTSLVPAPPRLGHTGHQRNNRRNHLREHLSVPEAWARGSARCDHYHNATPAGTVEGVGGHWSPILVLNVQGGVGKFRYIEEKVEHRVKGGGAGSCGTKRRGVRISNMLVLDLSSRSAPNLLLTHPGPHCPRPISTRISSRPGFLWYATSTLSHDVPQRRRTCSPQPQIAPATAPPPTGPP